MPRGPWMVHMVSTYHPAAVRALKALARQRGVSMATFWNEAVRDVLAKYADVSRHAARTTRTPHAIEEGLAAKRKTTSFPLDSTKQQEVLSLAAALDISKAALLREALTDLLGKHDALGLATPNGQASSAPAVEEAPTPGPVAPTPPTESPPAVEAAAPASPSEVPGPASPEASLAAESTKTHAYLTGLLQRHGNDVKKSAQAARLPVEQFRALLSQYEVTPSESPALGVQEVHEAPPPPVTDDVKKVESSEASEEDEKEEVSSEVDVRAVPSPSPSLLLNRLRRARTSQPTDPEASMLSNSTQPHPNPTAMKAPARITATGEVDADTYRNTGCGSYGACLDTALRKGWENFTCAKCPYFTTARAAAPKLEDYMRQQDGVGFDG